VVQLHYLSDTFLIQRHRTRAEGSLSFWFRASALESQNRKSDHGFGFLFFKPGIARMAGLTPVSVSCCTVAAKESGPADAL